MVLIGMRRQSYTEAFQQKLFPGNKNAMTSLYLSLVDDPYALYEYFTRFPETKNSLLSILTVNIKSLAGDTARADVIFRHYVQILYNVIDFAKKGVPIKMLEAGRKLWK